MLTKELNNIVDLYYSDSTYLSSINSKVNELITIFKKKSLKKFTQKDIEKYIKVLKIEHNNTNATINSKLCFLSKCLKYNQVNLVIPFQKVVNKNKSIITSEQLQVLLQSFKDNKELIQFVNIAYYTGLRANEILRIRYSHIIKDNNYYFINLYNTKNHKDNLIPVTPKLNKILDDFIEFSIDYKQVYYQLKKQGINAHQFRHTFITKCYEQGLDSFSIMRLTNQSSLSVHQRYVHHSNKQLINAIDKL